MHYELLMDDKGDVGTAIYDLLTVLRGAMVMVMHGLAR
jgi:hypothetical protein